MKFADLKVGDEVVDRWFQEWGVGTIMKKMKTRVHISFPAKCFSLIVYDAAHCQFLDPWSPSK